MERLTTDKPVKEMGMVELAYNSCFAKDGEAYYRDFSEEISARDLARKLYKIYSSETLSDDDDTFDEEMIEELQYDIEVYPEALIALFYRNLWAMADLRETLKRYEDLEEQGLLLRLPISVGSPIWDNDFGSPYRYEVTGFSYGDINEDDYDYDSDEELSTDELIVHYRNYNGGITGKFPISEIGKTVFLTQSEAEEKLNELQRQ